MREINVSLAVNLAQFHRLKERVWRLFASTQRQFCTFEFVRHLFQLNLSAIDNIIENRFFFTFVK